MEDRNEYDISKLPQRDFKGIWIPRKVWFDERLTALDKIILAEIDSLDAGEMGCYASNAHIAAFCQCSERKVSEAISKLIDLEYVYVKSFNGRERTLKSRVAFIGEADTQIPRGRHAKSSETGSKKSEADTQIPRESKIPRNTERKIESNNPNPQPRKRQKRVSELTQSQAASFERFWEAYPRKEAKASAEKAWAKINPPEELVVVIILAIAHQVKVDHRFREKRFTPHPATWLNGREWENTYETGGTQNGGEFRPSTGFRTDF